MVEVIYEALQNPEMYPTLDVDDMCNALEVSHLQLRSYIHHMRGKQPDVTEGLIHEIIVEGIEPGTAKRRYRLTEADIQQIYYRGKANKPKLCIATILDKINEGWSNDDIANLMDCTASRVSQIRCKYSPTNRKKRQVLNKDTRAEIVGYAKKHGVNQAAKFFNVAASTVYNLIKKGA